MEIGQFEIKADDNIRNLAEKILGTGVILSMTRICERYGQEEAEFRQYDVYKIKTKNDTRIMKKASEREASNYEKYLGDKNFNVPKYYGKYIEDKDIWIVLENIEGEDLRDMTDEMARGAAESISSIQNAYWNCSDKERFDVYIKRIEKRYAFIQNDNVISKAYKIFLDRQFVCPRTMSNGDLLQFNTVNQNGKVYIIDWGFGGIMPYSLDIARFIAHATKDKATFPFYMNDVQKEIFIDGVYKHLNEKPDYNQYLLDIKLAMLNEYVEFIEADEDENRWYQEHANTLAREILESKGWPVSR